MVVLTATCRNGIIEPKQPLPAELEGKQVQIQIEEVNEEVNSTPRKRRKAGSAAGQIWIAPDFDAPLEDFWDYMP